MRTLFSLALAALAAPALAQTRPLLTEQATTAPRGTLVLELGGDLMRAEPNFLTGQERDRYDAPVLRVVYSPADDVELDLEWVARVGVRADPGFGDASDWGDVSLRAKWRFGEEGRGRPALAARFGVTLPQTSFGNGLGPNTLRISAQALLTKTVGRAAVHANAGLAIQDEPLRAHEQRDFLAYGMAATIAASEKVELVGELAGLLGDGMPGADAHSELRAGLRYGRGALRFDAALRRGLAEADGTWGATAGVTWRARPR